MLNNTDNINREQCRCTMNCLNDTGIMDKSKFFCVWKDNPERMRKLIEYQSDSMG